MQLCKGLSPTVWQPEHLLSGKQDLGSDGQESKGGVYPLG